KFVLPLGGTLSSLKIFCCGGPLMLYLCAQCENFALCFLGCALVRCDRVTASRQLFLQSCQVGFQPVPVFFGAPMGGEIFCRGGLLAFELLAQSNDVPLRPLCDAFVLRDRTAASRQLTLQCLNLAVKRQLDGAHGLLTLGERALAARHFVPQLRQFFLM